MKIDLHLHSKYSMRPSQWILRKIKAHESYTEPTKLYELAKAAGMDKVTITDHNTIEGCLEISHLPDTFISEEVTTYLGPEQCKIHVLVYNIKEAQHTEIQRIRRDLFELVYYLEGEGLFFALAHPLWRINGVLNSTHLEQLILLFKNFEVNGSRGDDLNGTLKLILESLTPDSIERLSKKHGILPIHPEPWKKNLIGGSDDHSSLEVGRVYTQVQGARALEDFFEGIYQGRSTVIGPSSTALTLGRGLFSLAYQFYKSRFNLNGQNGSGQIIDALNKALLPPSNISMGGIKKKISTYTRPRRGASEEEVPMATKIIKNEVHKLLEQDPVVKVLLGSLKSGNKDLEKTWYNFVERLTRTALSSFTKQLVKGLSSGNLFEVIYSMAGCGISYFLLAPYITSYSYFAMDRAFCKNITKDLGLTQIDKSNSDIRIAHFTDTFNQVNGVALTLMQQAQWAVKNKKVYQIITCSDNEYLMERVRNFSPLAIFDIPEYPEHKICHPPLMEILAYCYHMNFDQIHTATPGALGLVALVVAKLLNIPILGTYHTAIPQYTKYLTEDPSMEELMWRYILWYYSQLDVIFAPSEHTRQELIANGMDASKVVVYPRGIDIERFHPAKRNGYLQNRYGLKEGTKALYVGRVSREKNLQVLAKAYREALKSNPDLHLIVTGDGPYLEEMKRELMDTKALFTGYLEGEDLSAVYASSDFFVFPSTTDTFGNVVLEAQASGIPVIVTDEGGPKENMVPGVTGLLIRGNDENALSQAMLELSLDLNKRKEMGRAARIYMESRGADLAFTHTWELYRRYSVQP